MIFYKLKYILFHFVNGEKVQFYLSWIPDIINDLFLPVMI